VLSLLYFTDLKHLDCRLPVCYDYTQLLADAVCGTKECLVKYVSLRSVSAKTVATPRNWRPLCISLKLF